MTALDGGEPPEHSAEEPELAPPYPEPYLEGLAHFDERRFWEAHEAWEELWLPLEAGPKLFYQGLIQAAAAFHHVTATGRWHAARDLFEIAARKLARYPERYGGLDVAFLVRHLGLCAEAAGRMERAEAGAVFDEALFVAIWPDED